MTSSRRIRSRLLTAVAVTITLAGCVVVPVPTTDHKVLAGKPVSNEQLAFLTADATTQAEVVERLGPPDVIWEDARVYAWDWVLRNGILLWAIGGGLRGYAGREDIAQFHSLLIEFDERGRVRRFERVVRPAWKSYGEFLREWARPSGVPAVSNSVE